MKKIDSVKIKSPSNFSCSKFSSSFLFILLSKLKYISGIHCIKMHILILSFWDAMEPDLEENYLKSIRLNYRVTFKEIVE